MQGLRLKPNPRGPLRNWREMYDLIERLRAEGLSLEVACVEVGVSYSTYHRWKKKIAVCSGGRP